MRIFWGTKTLDTNGKILIPTKARELLEISILDELEVITDNGNIILRKHRPSCTFCNSVKDLILVKNHLYICQDCMNDIKNTKNLENCFLIF